MAQATPNLALIIARDLLTAGRGGLLVLFAIFISAMGVVLSTHMTRQAIAEKDHTLSQREALDEEWRNLMLEETALAEHSRVQSLAEQALEMKRPDSAKEVILGAP
ncbi:cell division protein FtsL [Vibrio sp. SM6]|uniref:Cell division protein FtsL n=1 Tax=Vibrio agarilyticus TaxID=2726741 RepID=A0A7X8TP42_9VIBR|nr:cell division protein FtsL [Vibrio agarilyticus]NLS12303.1 cell division protein FtsL [Vibrio agarilyticus]